jgi:hypothetical protein
MSAIRISDASSGQSTVGPEAAGQVPAGVGRDEIGLGIAQLLDLMRLGIEMCHGQNGMNQSSKLSSARPAATIIATCGTFVAPLAWFGTTLTAGPETVVLLPPPSAPQKVDRLLAGQVFSSCFRSRYKNRSSCIRVSRGISQLIALN